MDHDACTRQQRLIRHVVQRDYSFRKRWRQISFIADKQHRATSDASRGVDTLAEEIARHPNRGRAQRKHDRRCAIVQKLNEFVRDLCFTIAVVETKSGDFGLRWPVRLRLREYFGEQCEDASGRMLAFEHWVAGVFKSELVAKFCYGLR